MSRLARSTTRPSLPAPDRSRALAVALGLAVALTVAPQLALACGGCFSPVPPTGPTSGQYVVQDAERVVFTHNPTTNLTRVWVEVRYTGAAKDFGWVLPMPKAPTVTVGTTVALDLIDARTAPTYKLTNRSAENCRNPRDGCEVPPQPDIWNGGVQDAATSADAGATGGGETAPNVTVLSAGQTGPYDYVVLASKSATALQSWLSTRGYKTPASATPIIQSHLDKGDVFVAIKLSNGQGVNQIRPVVLTMKDADACVPLRLTSIAAADDMSVVVTLGGPGRAVPKNMLHVQLNEAYINWQKGGSNYEQLLAAAIDEVGGRAFTTQSEQKGEAVAQSLWSAGQLDVSAAKKVTNLYELAKWLQSRGQTWLHGDAAEVFVEKAGIIEPIYKPFNVDNPLAALQQLWVCGAIWNGTVNTPNAPEKTPCIKAGASFFGGGPTLTPEDAKNLPVDGVALAAALDTDIAQPMLQLFADLKGSQSVTRLAMRISADEMDRDPIFGFNPALPSVDRHHSAERNLVCSAGWLPADQQRLKVPGLGSFVVAQDANTLAQDPRFAKAPMARVVEVLDESGAAIPVAVAQVDLVDTALAGAVLGEASPVKKLSLNQPNLWQPPASDSLVAKITPWKQPPNCTPRAGWVDGQLPPTGAGVDAGSSGDGASTADGGGLSDAVGGDGATGGSSGGASSGGSSGSSDGGCAAAPVGGGAAPVGLALVLLLAGLALLRRRVG